MFGNLDEGTISGVSGPPYGAATESIRTFSSSIVESVVSEMFHRGAPDETPTQNFNRRWHSDVLKHVLDQETANDQRSILPISAFVRQNVLNTAEGELNKEIEVKIEIPSPPVRSPSASSSATSEKEIRVRRARRERRNCEDREGEDSLEDPNERHRRVRWSRTSSEADSSIT